MLYVFHGSDEDTARHRAQALLRALEQKRQQAQVFRFDAEMFDAAVFTDLVHARGLFEAKHILFLSGVLTHPLHGAVVEGVLDEIARSPNVCIVHEGKLEKRLREKLDAVAEKCEEHAKPTAQRPAFNIFSLGDALGARDRRRLWVLYREALRNGHEPEEIHGTLFWAVKNMMLAKGAAQPDEAGQKPFVYHKFKRYAQARSDRELTRSAHELVELYHEAHRGRYELESALERWILTS